MVLAYIPIQGWVTDRSLRLTFSSDLEEAMLETGKSLPTTKIKFCL